jgi:translation initiation factor 6 (eIF-6)
VKTKNDGTRVPKSQTEDKVLNTLQNVRSNAVPYSKKSLQALSNLILENSHTSPLSINCLQMQAKLYRFD